DHPDRRPAGVGRLPAPCRARPPRTGRRPVRRPRRCRRDLQGGSVELKLDVNGRIVVVDADPATPLLDVLRDELRLFGTKDGCREGECGACTVLVDGLPVDSCLYPVAAAVDSAVETVESLWSSELGRRLQCGLVDEGGIQCGFCTPGV